MNTNTDSSDTENKTRSKKKKNNDKDKGRSRLKERNLHEKWTKNSITTSSKTKSAFNRHLLRDEDDDEDEIHSDMKKEDQDPDESDSESSDSTSRDRGYDNGNSNRNGDEKYRAKSGDTTKTAKSKKKSKYGGENSSKKAKKTKMKTQGSPRFRFSSKSRQSFEQNKTMHKIGLLSGKDKMMWARRAFFMSTERIFPGFIRNYGISTSRSRTRDPTGVKLRTSIPLKICLLAHSYFVPFWFLAFLMTQDFAASSLKPLHSYVLTCLTYVSMGTDILRLYAGFTSNTKDDMQMLALYWMGTIILQTPMMCFIFITHCFSLWLLPLNVSMDILLGTILLLEIWFGFWQLKGLVSSEIHLLHMARQMNEMNLLRDHGRKYQPRVINCPEKGPYVDWSSESESDSDSHNAYRHHHSRLHGSTSGGDSSNSNSEIQVPSQSQGHSHSKSQSQRHGSDKNDYRNDNANGSSGDSGSPRKSKNKKKKNAKDSKKNGRQRHSFSARKDKKAKTNEVKKQKGKNKVMKSK